MLELYSKQAMQFGREIFTSSPVPYITVDFEVVDDLFHSGFILVESKSINRKMRLSDPE